MTSKIRIKFGTVEVEFEGDPAFLRDDLPGLLEKLRDLAALQPAPPATPDSSAAAGAQNPLTAGTTGAISGKLNVSSGSDLAVAAGANLTFNGGKLSFTRTELLAEMKSTPTYYKDSYSGNLTKALTTLVKGGRFNEIAKDTYALTDSEAKELRNRLGK